MGLLPESSQQILRNRAELRLVAHYLIYFSCLPEPLKIAVQLVKTRHKLVSIFTVSNIAAKMSMQREECIISSVIYCCTQHFIVILRLKLY